MPLVPSQFQTPGNPPDTGDFVTGDSVASGPEGIAEEIVKLWNAILGTQHRIIADESSAVDGSTNWSGDLTGTGSAPVVAKIHGVAINTPPQTTTVFLRGDGTWVAPAISTLDGITVTGTPSSGQVLVASSSTTATWQTLGTTSGDYTANYLADY